MIRKAFYLTLDTIALLAGLALLFLGLWALAVSALTATTGAVLPGSLYAVVGFMVLLLRGLKAEGLI